MEETVDVRREMLVVCWKEAPHTSDSTVIYIPEDKVLFLGDATLGSFENGGTVESKAVKALQKFVDSLDVEWVLLGHEGAERR